MNLVSLHHVDLVSFFFRCDIPIRFNNLRRHIYRRSEICRIILSSLKDQNKMGRPYLPCINLFQVVKFGVGSVLALQFSASICIRRVDLYFVLLDSLIFDLPLSLHVEFLFCFAFTSLPAFCSLGSRGGCDVYDDATIRVDFNVIN